MKAINLFTILLISIIIVSINSSLIKQKFDATICDEITEFTQQIRQNIRNKSSQVQKIIDFVTKGADKGVTHRELATFVDTFGSRLAGTENLENAIDYMIDLLKKENHDNVHTEDAAVPKWTRGMEWARMLTPRVKNLTILGLGSSVGTGDKGITAEIIVVKTFDELRNRSKEVAGKIVVYNFDYQSYGQQVEYRVTGASEAAKYMAVAALIRSVTPFSIYSPHTGHQSYEDNVTHIPAASITVEDADLFQRLTSKGESITIKLYMEATNGGLVNSRNTISEIIGTDYPQQIVMVSGHLDSWDVGQGAMDDGGGAFISWRALSVIKKLGYPLKRTLRSILWTAEEFGYVGAKAYLKQHLSELVNMNIVMESDGGTFRPTGLSFSGKNVVSQCILSETLQLLQSINASQLFLEEDGSDIELFMDKGVPGSSLENQNDSYFDFHHSNGDTMTVEDSDSLDLCTAVWASTSYVFATLDDMLPR